MVMTVGEIEKAILNLSETDFTKLRKTSSDEASFDRDFKK